MKKMIIQRVYCRMVVGAFMVSLTLSVFGQNAIKYDSVFYLNGNIDVVTIVKNQSESIDCYYVGEDLITTINKAKLHKIVFKSGRIEICNAKEAQYDKIFLLHYCPLKNGRF